MPSETQPPERPMPMGRKTQKIFASAADPGSIAVFGRLASSPTISDWQENSTPLEGGNTGENTGANEIFTDDPEKIQNEAYEKGWGAAVVSDDSPALEDMNALFYLITRQLAYLFQNGIPEWDPATTYHNGSVCLGLESKKIYVSTTASNTTTPEAGGSNWVELGSDKATKEQLVTAAEALNDRITDATKAINERIDLAELSSNSVDVVGTYADLQNYDTSALTPNDIITVISDESNGSQNAYYRWDGAMFGLIGTETPIPNADENTKGLATLGAPGGAAKHESVVGLSSSLAAKLSTVAHDGTLAGDGTTASPLSVIGGSGGNSDGGDSSSVMISDTYFVDDKFGDDATGEKERMDKPFKTMEAALSQIVELGSEPASIIIDNWSFMDCSSSEQLPDGRWIIKRTEQDVLWTNGNEAKFTNTFAVTGSFQLAGLDDSGNLYIYLHSTAAASINGITVQPFHGILYNINTKTYSNTDWTAPAHVGGNIPAPGLSGGAIGSGGRMQRAPNGNLAYSYLNNTALITPDSHACPVKKAV